MPQQEEQQGHHAGFEQPDSERASAGKQSVVAANVKEERRAGGDYGKGKHPQRPGCKQDELSFMKQAGRIFEEKFEHGSALSSRLR